MYKTGTQSRNIAGRARAISDVLRQRGGRVYVLDGLSNESNIGHHGTLESDGDLRYSVVTLPGVTLMLVRDYKKRDEMVALEAVRERTGQPVIIERRVGKRRVA